jgi:tRNA pseudouridine55 synthase
MYTLKKMMTNIYETGQVLLINKPLHWTSADVVRKIRNTIKIKKVGHAGTLDPLATGLLILCTGKFTKRINEFMSQEKEYTGSFTLGAVTPTYDLESEPENLQDVSGLNADQINNATAQFTGDIYQIPPIYSAIKKNGQRAYALARRGEKVELQPRKISIRLFEITAIEMPKVNFRVVCSTGTYIRSLANDFGKALGCGGYLSSLCRTRIGDFTLAESTTLEEALEEIRKNTGAAGC